MSNPAENPSAAIEEYDNTDADCEHQSGNACNHEKTLRFIDSGYDLSILPIRRDDT